MGTSLQKINRFVVLMLENRSFDHLFGYLKAVNLQIAGLKDQEYSNYPDPAKQQPQVFTSPTAPSAMKFDPPHEFQDVQVQLYGPAPTAPDGSTGPNPRVNPASLTGFLFCGNQAATTAKVPAEGPRVLQGFAAGQVPYIQALAQEFALFNFWYSSLPGPTWPNRFFVHAATSGGLTDSPTGIQISGGYSFKNDTIYHALTNAGKDWRIYHDGLPQTAGIDSLRSAYVDAFTKNFREIDYFVQDIKDGILPEYTFIEPQYDVGDNYQYGNSMHPVNDVSAGDALVKFVYEALRNSNYWQDTMLIITFDEHGGFYDHVPPPAAVPTGDDKPYANAKNNFNFDLYGIRVPAIVISAYTQQGTVIGADPKDTTTIFDHTSILATVEARFNLPSLTARDAVANKLDVALNLDVPRTDAPTVLEAPSPFGTTPMI